jgi:multidrug efflux pump subunit AcrA (membrane-fusion protein)
MRWFVWSVLTVVVCSGIIGGGFFALRSQGFLTAGERAKPIAPEAGKPTDRNRVSVRTIHPQQRPNVVVSYQDIAKVEPFWQSDLHARVAGQVKKIHKDIDNTVTEGELLLEIDSPEVLANVELKAAEVEERRQDVRLAEEKARIAQAKEEVAKVTIDVMQAAVNEANETCDLRKVRYERFKLLAREGTKEGTKVVVPEVLDEAGRDYRIAMDTCAKAEANVRKASAEWKEMKATSAAALADIDHARALVATARKERDHAQALADLTKITAPFDGVIIERNVGPGSFVQNATTGGGGDALLTIARTDIMTVSMKVPDNYAPYVGVNTEAVLRLDELPGIVLHGRVTRFSPSIQTKDRTMHVEVDLYNGSAEEYRRFLGNGIAARLAAFGPRQGFQSLTLMAAGCEAWRRSRKGTDDPLPLVPRITGRTDQDQPHRLLPGMSGQMRLLLRRFENAYLLPNSAVFIRGGKRYIAQIVDGKVRLVPVRVQVDDGEWVKVAIVNHKETELGQDEIQSDLTGAEEIVASGQGDIEEGQPVNPSLDAR